jgi:hypothetical protein
VWIASLSNGTHAGLGVSSGTYVVSSVTRVRLGSLAGAGGTAPKLTAGEYRRGPPDAGRDSDFEW